MREIGNSEPDWAAEQSERFLRELGDRWAHTRAVGEKARRVAAIIARSADADTLIAAAYLHDIGYSPALMDTGFHPIDGAQYLRGVGRERLAGLVAHHSAARYEAEIRGLSSRLAAFAQEESAVSDALTYCDVTTSPEGENVSLEVRAQEVFDRYGETHGVSASVRAAIPILLAAVHRTEARLSA